VSFRPLLVEELAEFLAFDFGAASIPKLQAGWRPTDPDNDLPSMCSALLSIVEVNGSRIVQFTHPSVKEFLLARSLASSKAGSERFRHHIDTNRAHNMVFRASLAVLLSLDGDISVDGVRSFPLANYAARHWVDHIQSNHTFDSAIQSAIQLLLDPRMQHFTNWMSAYHPNGYPQPYSHTQNPSQINATSHYLSMYGCSNMSSLVGNNWSGSYNYGTPQRHRPWIVASVLGHVGILQYFSSNGVCLAYPSSMVPLHLASRGGHLDAVRFLLENGFTATKDGSGQTPLHYASQAGHLEVIQLLLERGADVTSPNNSGHTPLHYALQEGRLEIAQLLLERGADPNALDGSGHTPLHWALQGGHIEAIHLLLKRV
jgi:Ankyrin repeats (many copies)/Ankyrin repeats (3 copies)